MALRTLAIDTSGGITAVAVLEGDRVLVEDSAPAEERHAETLLPRIEQCLSQAGVTLGDLDLFAVGIGPGSFTGVRVGVATAKGLALATGKPVRGVVSLAALAASTRSEEPRLIVPILEAYKGEVFAAAYAVTENDTELLLQPFHAAPELAAERLAVLPEFRRARVLGSGYRRYTERLRAAWGGGMPEVLDAAWDSPRARDIAHEALRLMRIEGPSDLAQLVPLYVRESDAQLPKTKLLV